MGNSSRLADSTANQKLKMIEEEERFSVGDKLPNENDFAAFTDYSYFLVSSP